MRLNPGLDPQRQKRLEPVFHYILFSGKLKICASLHFDWHVILLLLILNSSHLFWIILHASWYLFLFYLLFFSWYLCLCIIWNHFLVVCLLVS